MQRSLTQEKERQSAPFLVCTKRKSLFSTLLGTHKKFFSSQKAFLLIKSFSPHKKFLLTKSKIILRYQRKKMQPESSSSAHRLLTNRVNALSGAEFERAVRGHLLEVFGPFQVNGPTLNDLREALHIRAVEELDTALGAYALNQGSFANATDQEVRNRLQRAKVARNRLQRARRNCKHASLRRSMIYRFIRRWIEE